MSNGGGGSSEIHFVDVSGRRKWDKAKFEKIARERVHREEEERLRRKGIGTYAASGVVSLRSARAHHRSVSLQPLRRT